MKIEKLESEKDKLELEVAIIEPSVKPKGVVQISHGMSEHKERYFDFMNYLAENGYVCVIHDHRGHGRSVKQKQDLGYFYTEDINYIIDDLHQVTRYIKQKYPDLKIYLFSHSMGTLVSRNYLKKYDNDIEKIILCGPPTENKMAGLGIFLAKLFPNKNKINVFLNNLTFRNYNKNNDTENSWICSNKDNVNKYNKDELCGYIFTTNGFINLYKLMKEAYNKNGWGMQNSDLNILVIAGEDDPVIQSKEKFNGLIEFLKQCGYKNIKSKMYEGKRHELINEKDNRIVYEDILNFIEK